MFLYPTDFIANVCVHFPLVGLRLPTMIYQTIIEFIEFLLTQLLSDLIFLSCSLQRHFILLLCPRKIFLHLNSLLLDKALSRIIQDVKVYLFD